MPSLIARQRIDDLFPPFLSRLLGPLAARRIPRETLATCQDCAMWRSPGAQEKEALYYLTATKCCTFYPHLPNFMVGAILSDRRAMMKEGQRRIRARIRTRVNVTPQGLLPSRKHMLLYRHAPHAFGRNRLLKCPLFDSARGACTIHPLSEARCRTWFCKYSTGEDGRLFWHALCLYLVAVEDTLAEYSVRTLGYAHGIPPRIRDAYTKLSPEDLDDRPFPHARHLAMWGPWAGREEEFYVRCFDLVSRLSVSAFRRLGGAPHQPLRTDVIRRLKALDLQHPPPILKRHPKLAATPLPDGRYQITTYSETDPIIVTKMLHDLLGRFDGQRCLRDIRAAWRRDGIPALSDNLLLQLYHHRILVIPGKPDQPTRQR